MPLTDIRNKRPRWAKVLALGFLASLLAAAGSCQTERPPLPASSELARVRPDIRNGAANGLWKYDGYPDLQSLDAHKTAMIADLKGPAQINTIHIGQIYAQPFEKEVHYERARAVVLRIYFDGAKEPAVAVPLGDFFADGNGKAAEFTSPFVEKGPGSYTCYIPMPFKSSALVTMENETDVDLYTYSVVEWQSLPPGENDLGYFHARWQRHSFQLTPETEQTFFQLEGPGHLVGEYWLVQTDEPMYTGMAFIMEANNEYRVDGERAPAINYLGSECAFNFCWGWQRVFNGYKTGVNIRSDKPGESVVSTFRFRDRDVIRFRDNLSLTLNWKAEFKGLPQLQDFLARVRERNAAGGGWVDYAETTYWYSLRPEGTGGPLPPVAERIKPLAHPNSPESPKAACEDRQLLWRLVVAPEIARDLAAKSPCKGLGE